VKSWHEGSLSLGAQLVVVARQARTLAQQRGGTPANQPAASQSLPGSRNPNGVSVVFLAVGSRKA
jgi:hypothetical protein